MASGLANHFLAPILVWFVPLKPPEYQGFALVL